METVDEIERLRANVIVQGALLQALIEEWPAASKAALRAQVAFKLEAFTARNLASTMPESFVQAQQVAAAAWLSVLGPG